MNNKYKRGFLRDTLTDFRKVGPAFIFLVITGGPHMDVIKRVSTASDLNKLDNV